MNTELPYHALAGIKANLADPNGCTGCARPVTVQKLVKYISHNTLDIRTIDRDGNDTLHAIDEDFLKEPLHNFYDIHYQGITIGRLYFANDRIKHPKAVKDALEIIIDDALSSPLNGQIHAIHFNKDCSTPYRIEKTKLDYISLGNVLNYC